MKNKTIKRIFAVALVLFTTFSVVMENVVTARADTISVLYYDETDVMDDLTALEGFDVENYPKVDLKEGEKPWVMPIHCSEYCYSENAFYDDYYGVYLYVYNPSQRAIEESGHCVNMAITYDADGVPLEYGNMDLTLLSSDSNNRFFKFKISDKKTVRELAGTYAETHNKRRYDFAGVQLAFVDWNKLDTDYGRTYFFSGYSKGLAVESQDESTLSSSSTDLDTIDLDVNHTFYRSDFLGTVADEINTVYFSVPNEVFENYGEQLQKIKAEWHEYKTKPVFITSNTDAYDGLEPYLGQALWCSKCSSSNKNMTYPHNCSIKWRVVWGEYKFASSGLGRDYIHFINSYNGWTNDATSAYVLASSEGIRNWFYWYNSTPLSRMDWLFKVENVGNIDDFRVTSDEIKNYMRWYTDNIGQTSDKVSMAKLGNISLDLFEDTLGDERIKALGSCLQGNTKDEVKVKRGHVVQEIDADDTGTFLFEKNQSAWNKFWFGAKYDEKSYSPIVVIEDETALADMTADVFADTYYVNDKDAPTVLQYCKDELNAGRKPVLFRFAQTEYYADKARFDKYGDANWENINGYVAQETMFLGFDVISLTFQKDGGAQAVLPVVADPVDIVNDFTPPPDMPIYITGKSYWEEIVAMIIALCVCGAGVIIAPRIREKYEDEV